MRTGALSEEALCWSKECSDAIVCQRNQFTNHEQLQDFKSHTTNYNQKVRTGLSSWRLRRLRGTISAYTYIHRWRNKTMKHFHTSLVRAANCSRSHSHVKKVLVRCGWKTYMIEKFTGRSGRNWNVLILGSHFLLYLKKIQTSNYLKGSVIHTFNELGGL